VASHLGIEHQSFNLDPDEAFHLLSLLPDLYGQPLADISAIPTLAIAHKVSRRFDAIFDGQGPDFMFGNFDLRTLYYCYHGIPRRLRNGVSRLSQFLARNVFRTWTSPNLDVGELLRQPEFFWVFTRMFKSHDLERLVGEPVYAESFWCHRFLQSRTDIPLAERLRLARPKRGFIMDFVEFGVDKTRALTDRYLTRKRLNETGLFNAEFALKCVDDYYRGDTNMGPKLWTLLMFEMWREKLSITGVAGVSGESPRAARQELTAV
jgi:hypothetical protein